MKFDDGVINILNTLSLNTGLYSGGLNISLNEMTSGGGALGSGSVYVATEVLINDGVLISDSIVANSETLGGNGRQRNIGNAK